MSDHTTKPATRDAEASPLRTDRWPVQQQLSAHVTAGHDGAGHYALAATGGGEVTDLLVLDRREGAAFSAFVDACEARRMRREA